MSWSPDSRKIRLAKYIAYTVIVIFFIYLFIFFFMSLPGLQIYIFLTLILFNFYVPSGVSYFSFLTSRKLYHMKFAIFDVARCRMSATSLTFWFYFVSYLSFWNFLFVVVPSFPSSFFLFSLSLGSPFMLLHLYNFFLCSFSTCISFHSSFFIHMYLFCILSLFLCFLILSLLFHSFLL